MGKWGKTEWSVGRCGRSRFPFYRRGKRIAVKKAVYVKFIGLGEDLDLFCFFSGTVILNFVFIFFSVF